MSKYNSDISMKSAGDKALTGRSRKVGKEMVTRKYSAEDQALNQIAKEADAKLAAKRAARAEAREVRMRELERRQSEFDEDDDEEYDDDVDSVTGSGGASGTGQTKRSHTSSSSDTVFNSNKPASSSASNHLSSTSNHLHQNHLNDISTVDDNDAYVDIKAQMYEMEDKFRKALVTSAQLDNEKQALKYQVELLKDQLEDITEANTEFTRENKDLTRTVEHLKREKKSIEVDINVLRTQIQQRDNLIEEHGLIFLGGATGGESSTDDSGVGSAASSSSVNPSSSSTDHSHSSPSPSSHIITAGAALVSPQVADLIGELGEGSINVTIRKLMDAKHKLTEENKSLRQDLEHLEEKQALAEKLKSKQQSTGPTDTEFLEMQKEYNRQLQEYRHKIQKLEQDKMNQEGNMARLESQVKRYKGQLEQNEESEQNLKSNNRKLQREIREKSNLVEDLEMKVGQLEKRLEKRQTRGTIGAGGL